MPIDPRMVKWDDAPSSDTLPNKIDPRMVKWADEQKPDDTPSVNPLSNMLNSGSLGAIGMLATPEGRQRMVNGVSGMVRGAGSIGSTLMYPIDKITDMVKGDREQKLSDLVTGNKPISRNEERRASIDEGLQNLVGADPNSWEYKGGKLTGEIAGTAGAGGAIAKVLGWGAPALMSTQLGSRVGQSIATGGMSLTPKIGAALPSMGRVADLGVRGLGGAITGGAAAGMVDPNQAKDGAMIGAAAPALFGLAGYGANKIGQLVKGSDVPESIRSGVKAAQDAGYVIPPTQANPSLKNRLLEGAAGKLTTAQNASAKNQSITNGLAADTLGLPRDVQISPEVLNGIRKKAGQAYEAVGSTGMIKPNASYEKALDDITQTARSSMNGFPNAKPPPIIDAINSLKSAEFDAASAVSKIGELRDAASSAYAQGDKSMGKGLKDAAGVLEDVIDQHLQKIGAPSELLDGFRSSRQLIAKTYSVEKALNPTTGTIDALKLASQLNRGKPLSGGLKTAAEFAQQFPKAAQPLEKMGSLPQLSPLDWAAGGGMSMASGNPLMLAAPLLRPAARSLALSPMVQRGLLSKPSSNTLSGLLTDPDLSQLAYRSLPLAANR